LNWWYSTETLSKVLNWLAVLVTLLGIATLTLKLRYDYLKRLADAPRQLTQDQRAKFIAALANVPKGKIGVAYSSPQPETIQFVAPIRSLLSEAGFSVPENSEYALGYVVTTVPPPWRVGLISGSEHPPAFTLPLQRAFREIGLDAIGIDGRQIAQPNEVKVYVGSK